MTQEEKQLLLKDICARLPYRVMAKVDGHINPLQIYSVEQIKKSQWAWKKGTWVVTFWNDTKSVEHVKPYLRPMSSMTEEEEIEYDATFETIQINGHYDSVMTYKSFDYFNEHHFDYRGLIEKGLALEAPKGMYNFK